VKYERAFLIAGVITAVIFQVVFLGAQEIALSVPPGIDIARLAVPQARVVPRIDGHIEEGEWSDGAMITGLMTFPEPNPACNQPFVFVKYDNDKLYVAFKSRFDSGHSLLASISRRDGPVWIDDTVALYIDPYNGREMDKYIAFIGNSAGVFLDSKNEDVSWDGAWEFENVVREGLWTSEIAIPFKELGVSSPGEGQKWGMNFCRGVQTPSSEWLEWSDTSKPHEGISGFSNVKRFAEVSFGKQTPAVRIMSIGEIRKGRAALTAEIQNNADTAVDIKVKLEARPWDFSVPSEDRFWFLSDVVTRVVKECTIESGKTAHVDLAKELTDGGRMVIEYLIQNAKTNEIYFHNQIPVTLQEPLEIRLESRPSQKEISVELDATRFFDGELSMLYGEISVKSADGRIFLEGGPKTLEDREVLFNMNTGALKAGRYDIEALLRDVDGNVVKKSSISFSIPDDSEWVRKEVIAEPIVLPGYAPVYVYGNAFRLQNREYVFQGASLLPTDISIDSEDILSAPIELEIITDDSPLVLERPRTRYVEKKSTHIIFARERASEKLGVSVRYTVEYDGLLKFELRIIPRGSVNVRMVRLKIPLKKDLAQLVNYSTGESKRSGKIAKSNWHSGFVPYFWVGNGKRGLFWFAESDKNWNLRKKDNALEMLFGKDETTLVVNFIDNPTSLYEPSEITFGLLATPVKKMPYGWRSWRFERYPGSGGGVTHAIFRYDQLFHPGETFFDIQSTDNIHTLLDESYEPNKDINAILEFPLWGIPMQWKYLNYYIDEWKISPQQMPKVNGYVYGCPKSDYGKFFIWSVKKALEKVDVDGVYFDAARVFPCSNQRHSHGYVTLEGNVSKEVPIFETRDFVRKLSQVFVESGIIDHYVVCDVSNSMAIPSFTFAGCLVNGRQFADLVEDDYSLVVPPDRFRAEFLGAAWGIPMFVYPALPQKYQHARNPTGLLMGMAMLHDAQVWAENCNKDVIKEIRQVSDEFELDDADFFGYWEIRNVLRCESSDMKASFYKIRGRDEVLLILVNFGEFDLRRSRIYIDFDSIGMPGKVRAYDPIDRENIEADRKGILVDIEAKTFSLVVLE